MRLATTLRYLYFAYFSKPVADRKLFRSLRTKPRRKILEIGISSIDRSLRLLNLARRMANGETPRYSAVDSFEARGPSEPKLSLKDCHRLLTSAQTRSQLIPGDPAGALARVANSLPDVDLVLISAAHDDGSLAGAWFYLPRMMHADTLVLRQTAGPDGLSWQVIDHDQIRRWAGPSRRRAA